AFVLDLGVTRLELRGGDDVRRGPEAQVVRQQYLAQFKAADTDNNGYLDMREAQQSPLFRNLFKAMDRDGDGKLFEKEVIAYLDEMQDLQTRALTSCAALAITDQGRGIFDLIDANHDGRLSVREMRNAGKVIDQLDRDGDGCVARNEIPRSFQLAL